MEKKLMGKDNANGFERLRTKDFRHIYANGTSIIATKSDIRINFGIIDPEAKIVEEEVSIYMNVDQAKLLSNSLKNFFDNFQTEL